MNLLSFLNDVPLNALTFIADGNDEPLVSVADGQVFALNVGDRSILDDAPALTILDDDVSFANAGLVQVAGNTAAISIEGLDGAVINFPPGVIVADLTAIDVLGDLGDVINAGFISGGFNGVRLVGDGGELDNLGEIASDSRAVEIIGNGITVRNVGDIVGTGNQRNGTVYANSTAEDYTLRNGITGRIDAGFFNEGAGVSFEVGDEVGEAVDITIVNEGAIAGRGDAALGQNTRGDGIRLFSSVDGGTTYDGELINRGFITSDFARGIEVRDGLGISGRILNAGVIFGATDGLYLGDAQHDVRIVNSGFITSDSRAVNIDGSEVHLVNRGLILGTGDQRNGTVYSDATAEDYRVVNLGDGVIDAGLGNEGAGVVFQIGEVAGDLVEASLVNRGLIVGRGEGAGNLAGDGVRLFAGVEGGVTAVGNIVNHGTIVGSDDGIDLDDDPAGLHVVGTLVNRGLIEASSDGIEIGGGVTLTGDLRNVGAIVADDDGFDINAGAVVNGDIVNRGTIDAGDEGILFDGAVMFNGDLRNHGEITAVDHGIAVEAGTAINGQILNRGTIDGGSTGVLVEDGVSFLGRLVNLASGVIDGGIDGVSILNAEEGPTIINLGTILSNSRAVNIDGAGTDLKNFGEIIGTSAQRNGTVYANSTAEDYLIENRREGVIDAGEGNDGSGVSLQTGDVDGDVVVATLHNRGTIAGRGDAASGNTIGDGVRLFSDVDDAVWQGDLTNDGVIEGSADSDVAVGIRIEDGVTLDGTIVNTGTIVASAVAIDATWGGGAVEIVNNGEIAGDVLLSGFNDTFDGREGTVDGVIAGNGGDDTIVGGASDDVLSGGAGDDELAAGEGSDVFVVSPQDGPSFDTILDFEVGADRLDASGASPTAIILDDGDTIVRFAPDLAVRLIDVDLTSVPLTDILV